MPKQSKQTDNTGKSRVILKFLYQSTSFKNIIKLCLKSCMLHSSLYNDTIVHGRKHTYPQQEKQINKKKKKKRENSEIPHSGQDSRGSPNCKSCVSILGASQMVQWVKNTPTMQKTQEVQVRSLGKEDPLEESLATHSSILFFFFLNFILFLNFT